MHVVYDYSPYSFTKTKIGQLDAALFVLLLLLLASRWRCYFANTFPFRPRSRAGVSLDRARTQNQTTALTGNANSDLCLGPDTQSDSVTHGGPAGPSLQRSARRSSPNSSWGRGSSAQRPPASSSQSRLKRRNLLALSVFPSFRLSLKPTAPLRRICCFHRVVPARPQGTWWGACQVQW